MLTKYTVNAEFQFYPPRSVLIEAENVSDAISKFKKGLKSAELVSLESIEIVETLEKEWPL